MHRRLGPYRTPAETPSASLPEPHLSASAAEIERFWAEGHAAYPPAAATILERLPRHSHLKMFGESCCTGVDVPSVGLVHSYDCPATERPVSLRADRSYQPGQVPDGLRRFLDDETGAVRDSRQDRLLVRLVFAARRLAARRIGWNLVLPEFDCCLECGAVASPNIALRHAPECAAGQVLAILAELVAPTPESSYSNKKEAAAEEGDRAGDATRRRGVSPAETPYDWASELTCSHCGRKGGEGWALLSQQGHCNRVLAANECELRKGGWGYIYVHNCGPEGGARK